MTFWPIWAALVHAVMVWAATPRPAPVATFTVAATAELKGLGANK